MNDKDFNYYAYRLNINESRDLQDFMQKGIINQEGNGIAYVALPINTEPSKVTPEEYIKSLITKNYNTVAIIKIPKEYFMPSIAGSGLKQMPLPIWKEIIHGYDMTISALDSDYVYRVYYKNKRGKLEYLSNLNYSPVVDPVGKQYDNAQLNNFFDMEAEKIYDFAIKRRRNNFDSLCQEDLASHFWDPFVTELKEIYRDADDFKLSLNKKQDN